MNTLILRFYPKCPTRFLLLIHAYTHTQMATQGGGLPWRSTLGFSVLPEVTLTRGQERWGIKPPTLCLLEEATRKNCPPILPCFWKCSPRALIVSNRRFNTAQPISAPVYHTVIITDSCTPVIINTLLVIKSCTAYSIITNPTRHIVCFRHKDAVPLLLTTMVVI